MFNFRIIILPDGNQVIDQKLKTPFKSLTIEQMEDYIEVDNMLSFIERVKRKEHRQREQKKKISKNLFWKLVCFFGIGEKNK